MAECLWLVMEYTLWRKKLERAEILCKDFLTYSDSHVARFQLVF